MNELIEKYTLMSDIKTTKEPTSEEIFQEIKDSVDTYDVHGWKLSRGQANWLIQEVERLQRILKISESDNRKHAEGLMHWKRKFEELSSQKN